MSHGVFRVPAASNERPLDYAPGAPSAGSCGRASPTWRRRSSRSRSSSEGARYAPDESREVRASPPRPAARSVAPGGREPRCRPRSTRRRAARRDWGRGPSTSGRPSSSKAADLLAGGWRQTLNGATMLNQSKTPSQAEIDSACEIIDFWRFNVGWAEKILEEQPVSSSRRVEPGRVPAARGLRLRRDALQLHLHRRQPAHRAALMGNTVLWKPASSTVYSGWFILKLLEAAGLPPGVINFVPGPGRAVGDPALASPEFAGIHFTGSTAAFHGHVADHRREPAPLPQLPAHRGRDGRQGLRLRPPFRRRGGRSPPRSAAAPSSSRARSARPPRAPTSPRASGRP